MMEVIVMRLFKLHLLIILLRTYSYIFTGSLCLPDPSNFHTSSP